MSGLSFADLTKLWTLAEAWLVPGEAVVSAGGELIFVANGTADFEGMLLGLDFSVESADLKTSPVKLVKVGTQAYSDSANVLGDPVMSFSAPITRNRGGFAWPFPWGVPVEQGKTVALQWKNNESVSLTAWGCLWGIRWKQNALASLTPDGSTAGVTALSGGPGVSSQPLQGVFCR